MSQEKPGLQRVEGVVTRVIHKDSGFLIGRFHSAHRAETGFLTLLSR